MFRLNQVKERGSYWFPDSEPAAGAPPSSGTALTFSSGWALPAEPASMLAADASSVGVLCSLTEGVGVSVAEAFWSLSPVLLQAAGSRLQQMTRLMMIFFMFQSSEILGLRAVAVQQA
jgi:hypothetical protein